MLRKLARPLLIAALTLAGAAALAPHTSLADDIYEVEPSLNNSAKGGELGTEDMALANEAAGEVVRKRMEHERPADFQLLKAVKQAEIIVIKSNYDRVEDVLGAVGVPHLLITERELEQIELDARQLVMINCAGALTPTGLTKIERFVRAGGFLYTTDWALTNVIERAFPGYIKYNGNPTGNDVVAVEIQEKDNVFLQHVQLTDTQPRWWLEGSSYPIKVLKPDAVKVLIGSKEMKEKYHDGAIAVTFSHGDGRVLHIVSHFYLQQNDMRDAREQASADEYLKGSLPADVVDSLEDSDALKRAKGGDVTSAYANQQFTTNIIVERKRDQERIEKLYDKRVTTRGDVGGKKVEAGTRVRVVERKGAKVKVRTLSGEEAWFDADMVE